MVLLFNLRTQSKNLYDLPTKYNSVPTTSSFLKEMINPAFILKTHSTILFVIYTLVFIANVSF